MVIRMRTNASGPEGTLLAGQCYDVAKATAEAWVASGNATPAPSNVKPRKIKRDESGGTAARKSAE